MKTTVTSGMRGFDAGGRQARPGKPSVQPRAAGHVPRLLTPYINVAVALLLPWALHRTVPALRPGERGA